MCPVLLAKVLLMNYILYAKGKTSKSKSGQILYPHKVLFSHTRSPIYNTIQFVAIEIDRAIYINGYIYCMARQFYMEFTFTVLRPVAEP